MRINHNIASSSAQGTLFKANRTMSKSLEKLSTGLRINSAADDAAGLGVSENLRKQVRGMSQALKNTQDAIALLQIADGALNEQTNIVQRMRELTVQALNGTYTSTELSYMGQEFSQLMEELDRIASVTNYNGLQIFATPEMAGNTNSANGRIYGDANESAAPETAHKTALAGSAWNDLNDAVFGANDSSSAHHFNMMVGADIGNDLDAGVYHSNTESFEKNAENFVTIQFGQMDSNGIFSLQPSSRDGSNVFDDFGFDTLWNGAVDDDTEDNRIASGTGSNTTASVRDKLQLLLQVIDGKNEEISSLMKLRVFANGSADNTVGLERINKMRSSIGAMINRMEHTANNLTNQITSTQSAESLIRDADFAQETATFTKNQILVNSSTAMLSQANMIPQGMLRLVQ